MNFTLGIIEDNPEYRNFLEKEIKPNQKIVKILYWKSAEEFLSDKGNKIDILLLDMNLPHMNGLDLIKEISSRKMEIKIIILSAMMTEDIIFQALKAGAIGYAHKLDSKNINEVIQTILDDGAYLSPTIALKMINYLQGPTKTNKDSIDLTPKEIQVLKLTVDGETAIAIAKLLDISENTVRFHIRNIYQKLQVKNRIELVKTVERKGLL